jgi:hypothetical protein
MKTEKEKKEIRKKKHVPSNLGRPAFPAHQTRATEPVTERVVFLITLEAQRTAMAVTFPSFSNQFQLTFLFDVNTKVS